MYPKFYWIFKTVKWIFLLQVPGWFLYMVVLLQWVPLVKTIAQKLEQLYKLQTIDTKLDQLRARYRNTSDGIKMERFASFCIGLSLSSNIGGTNAPLLLSDSLGLEGVVITNIVFYDFTKSIGKYSLINVGDSMVYVLFLSEK